MGNVCGLKLPLWVVEKMQEHGDTPTSYEDASDFLNHIFEIGKHSSFTIKFKKSDGTNAEIVLTKDNAEDIFYSPIWKNASEIVRANCVKWYFEKAKQSFTNDTISFSFISLIGSDVGGECDYTNKNIFIDIHYQPMYVLNCILHELKHYSQKEDIPTIQKKPFSALTDLEILKLQNTMVSISKNEDKNFILYLINPLEIEAVENAYIMQKPIYEKLQQKFGKDSETEKNYEAMHQTIDRILTATELTGYRNDELMHLHANIYRFQHDNSVLRHKAAKLISYRHNLLKNYDQNKITERLKEWNKKKIDNYTAIAAVVTKMENLLELGEQEFLAK